MQEIRQFLYKAGYSIFNLAFFLSFIICLPKTNAQGTWTKITNPAPDINLGSIFLLSDGTVLAKTISGGTDSVGNIYDRLTPDIHGSYANGTWSTIAPMHYTRVYYSTRMLKDGRMYVAGGEYGSGADRGEIYDPATDKWTDVNYNGETMYDANSALLPDGEVLQAFLSTSSQTSVHIYNPSTNSYEYAQSTKGNHDETAWLTLPNQDVIFVDFNDVFAEQYIPSIGTWNYTNNTPVGIYDSANVHEAGAAIMLPNGNGFFLGGSGHTLFYTPPPTGNVGTWNAGPNLPNNSAAIDAPVALMNNARLLCVTSAKASSSNLYPSPSTFYEFNYLNNSFKAITAPDGSPSVSFPSFEINMLNLPSGQVMVSFYGTSYYYLYTPDGIPLASGKPTIKTVKQNANGCDTFKVTGTLFNGLSEGSAYGDDWQNATNYPIVRLTRGSNVYYARTFNWNRVGIQTGALPDTAEFTLPGNLGVGNYALQVIANGIASDTVNFINVNGLTSTLTPASICSGDTFTYHAVTNIKNPTITWTRAEIPGINNPAVNVTQYADPKEVLVNSTLQPVSVVYKYQVTGNGCTFIQNVSVIVNPTGTYILGNANICNGSSTILTAYNASSYVWSTGATTASITVSPTVTTTYTVTGTSQFGCVGSIDKIVRVRVCTGIASTDSVNKILLDVHPNPLKDQSTIWFKVKEGGYYTLKISDMLGRTLNRQSGEANPGENTVIFNFDNLAGGIYLLTLQKDDEVVMLKLIK